MLLDLQTGITNMEDGKLGLGELQETKICTWELSVSHEFLALAQIFGVIILLSIFYWTMEEKFYKSPQKVTAESFKVASMFL